MKKPHATARTQPSHKQKIWETLDNLVTLSLRFPITFVLVTKSCPTLCDPIFCSPPGPSVHGILPGKNTGVGCHFLLHGFFLIQGSNPGLWHCRQILYCLSHREALHWPPCSSSNLQAYSCFRTEEGPRSTGFSWLIFIPSSLCVKYHSLTETYPITL